MSFKRYKFIVMLLPLLVACTPDAREREIDFTLLDVNGVNHRLADYRGKWVVVNFWATWCPPCLEEIPELEAFHAKHKDKDAVVLGINAEDIELANLKEFIDDYFITYPILIEGEPNKNFDPDMGLPRTYLISPEGEIATSHLGSVTGEAIEKFIRANTENYQQKSSVAPTWMPWKRHAG